MAGSGCRPASAGSPRPGPRGHHLQPPGPRARSDPAAAHPGPREAGKAQTPVVVVGRAPGVIGPHRLSHPHAGTVAGRISRPTASGGVPTDSQPGVDLDGSREVQRPRRSSCGGDARCGRVWSPTPLPRGRRDTLPDPARLRLQHVRAYLGRHPLGGVSLRGSRRGREVLSSKVRNLSGRPCRLSATGYVEWALGDLRPRSAPGIAARTSTTARPWGRRTTPNAR